MHKLYYISQGKTPQEHLKNIKYVCEKLESNSNYNLSYIQLRLKEVSNEEYLSIAKSALEICNYYQAKLIINDNVFVANEIDCHGIHVGKNDEAPISIRQVLSKNKIIGGTANTLEDCLNLIAQKVDYIGLGPFKHTTTKKVLSPILGLKGYKSILAELKKQGSTTPIYAIGGIELEDIEELLKIGFTGVAISSALTKTSSSQSEDVKNNTENQRLLNSLTSNILNS